MERKLTLKELSPYLPYGLKCQYEGIINGKELSEQDKAFKADGRPFDFYVEPIKGIKVAELKQIIIFKNYWKAYIGKSAKNSKSFVNGYDFKPLLLPLSELKVGDTKWEYLQKQYNPKNDINWKIDVWLTTGEETWHPFASRKDNFGVQSPLPLSAYLKFFEWHFDVFGLIPAGLALNKNEPGISR